MTRTEQKVQERYAARPFNLKAYAQAARGTVEQFCRDMGIDSAVVYVWSRAQEAPWCLYERAVAKFGQAGFSAPAKVWREGRPFRVPAHILGTPTPTPVAVEPVPAPPPKIPATSAELLLQLATQLDEDARKQEAKLEELAARLKQVEDALATLKETRPAPVLAPKAVEPAIVKATPPKRPTLEEIVAHYNNGSKITWLVSNRAAKEYNLLSHQDQDRAVEAIKALIDAPNWHKVPKARQVPPAHHNPFPQAKDLWYLRHGKYRTFISRQGQLYQIRAIVDRGDKQFFGYEL